MERSTDQNRTAGRPAAARTGPNQAMPLASRNGAAGAGIYGGNPMTEQERNQYRERLGR
jgi:hypothetical protein